MPNFAGIAIVGMGFLISCSVAFVFWVDSKTHPLRCYVSSLSERSMSPENEIRLKLLRSAPLDSWIALSEDETRIVAIGKTYSEVSALSDAAGEADPLILKTPTRWEAISVIAR